MFKLLRTMVQFRYFLQALVANGLVAYTLVTVLLFVNKDVLQEYVNNNPAMKDLNHLITAESKL
jgi:hypothetical protein